jgi:CheY-like chemotaxis protein
MQVSTPTRMQTNVALVDYALRLSGLMVQMQAVLVVDDDIAVRRPMARLLGLEGFEVIEANNGQEALTCLRAGLGIAVIVLDLRMPVMDGWTFRTRQRADPLIANIPVIVVSGADTERFGELEAFATLQKPVAPSSVVNLLRELLPNQ